MTLLVLALLALPGWIAAVDAARIPADAWRGTGNRKSIWIVLLVALGWLGALIYCLAVRPRLRLPPSSARPLGVVP